MDVSEQRLSSAKRDWSSSITAEPASASSLRALSLLQTGCVRSACGSGGGALRGEEGMI